MCTCSHCCWCCLSLQISVAYELKHLRGSGRRVAITIYRHGGLECYWFTLGENSWGVFRRRWKITELLFEVDAPRFAGIRPVFSFQYGQQILKTGRPTSWAKRLLEVVACCSVQIKGETRLTGKEKKNNETIKEKKVFVEMQKTCWVGRKKISLNCEYTVSLPAWLIGKRIKESYQPQLVLESLSAERSITKTDTPIVYYLLGWPKRGFVREDLLTPRHMWISATPSRTYLLPLLKTVCPSMTQVLLEMN